MCGIAGCYYKHKISDKEISQVKEMNKILQHRGPDDEGIFNDSSCVLGHRRLSIIDLSVDGHQPFFSDDSRYILTYNGEIYNYIEIRESLQDEGLEFTTKTDNEVLLKAFIKYGEDCLHLFNGMFAFAIYDKEKDELFLARDRFGIKPLYYFQEESKLYFASEIKALSFLLKNKTVNEQAVFDYMVFNRTDVYDETFIKEIRRLPKGCFARFNDTKLNITNWWNPEDFLSNKKSVDMSSLLKNIESTFLSSVNFRMRSDVAVGACLSGGLDSSILIGSLFEKKHVTEFDTFTASFPNHPIDETSYIDKLKEKYPFNNHRTFPSGESAYENLKEFVYVNDDPTTNSSFYSQYEVMKLANEKGITVLLDGQGGDENFAGYQYFHGFYLNGLLRKLKLFTFFKEFFKVLLRNQDKSAYQTFIFQLLPKQLKKKLLYKQVPFLKKEFFDKYIDSSLIFNEFFNAPDLNTSLVRHFQYKLEHLLRMEDRNSMAFSIEARVPYLDHNLVELLIGTNENMKIKLGQTKFLQKAAIGKYTIDEIANRKDKIGFGTPRDEWMQKKFWQDFTDKNNDYLKNNFSNIFCESGNLRNKGFERWKINQLAIWHQINKF